MSSHSLMLRAKPLFRGLILSILFFLNCSAPAIGSDGWETLTQGIEYRDMQGGLLTPWAHIHVFRVNLKLVTISLISARDLGQSSAPIQQFMRQGKPLAAINGGFFDREFKPLGLRISNHQQKSALKPISWWGVFFIKNNGAHIAAPKQFNPHKDISFAIQSGPRLLVNGLIPSLKPGTAERSALGITKDGRVILLVTDNKPMTTTQLAALLKEKPLSCLNALNLDGGSSSQLLANINNFNLSVHGFSNLADVIVVNSRSNSLKTKE